MAIHRFLNLSIEFYQASEKDLLKGFILKRLPGRITEVYEALGTKDRLRVHGIIDNTNHLQDGRRALGMEEQEKKLELLEKTYGFLIDRQVAYVLKEMNARGGPDKDSYEKVKFLGCIPVYIALDLGNVLHQKPISPHPSPFGAI